ncbi:MAG: hypothetical protein WBM40_05750 [Thiohalocapsa sp.]
MLDGLAAAADTELAVDAFEMGVDGVGGDEEAVGNFLALQSLCEELDDVEFTVGQGLDLQRVDADRRLACVGWRLRPRGRAWLFRIQPAEDFVEKTLLGAVFAQPRAMAFERHARFEEGPQPTAGTRKRDRLVHGWGGSIGVSSPFQGDGFEHRDLDQLTLKPALAPQLADRGEKPRCPLEPCRTAVPD